MKLTRSFDAQGQKSSRLVQFRGGFSRVSAKRRVVTTITAIAVAALSAGCGVRLEVAPPTELEPTRNEIARQAIVLELDTIAQLSVVAASNSTGEVAESLTSLAQVSRERATALGGVYESGLPHIDGTGTEPSVQPAPTQANAEDVVEALNESALRIRSTVSLPDDSQLARVLGSVAIAQVSSAQHIALLTDTDAPLPQALVATPLASSPLGLDTETISKLVLLEDKTGYALEVIAAMQDPKERSFAKDSASSHRTVAQALADQAGISQTAQDPREVLYPLPLVLDADTPVASEQELSELAGSLESELTQAYLVALALVEPEARESILDLAMDRALLALTWNPTSDEFPFLTDEVAVTTASTS